MIYIKMTRAGRDSELKTEKKKQYVTREKGSAHHSVPHYDKPVLINLIFFQRIMSHILTWDFSLKQSAIKKNKRSEIWIVSS